MFFKRWLIAGALSLMLLGSYIYIQNQIAYGAPFGPMFSRIIQNQSADGPHGAARAYARRLRDNVGRYIYQLVDLSTLPLNLAVRVNPAKAMVFSGLYHWLHIWIQNPETSAPDRPEFDQDYINPLNENASWFGPVAVLLIVAVLYQAIRAIRGLNPLTLVLVILAVGFLFVHSASSQWTPAKGRYYQIPVALAFPLIACLLETRKAWWRAILTFFIVVLGLTSMFTVMHKVDHVFAQASVADLLSGVRRPPNWLSGFGYRMVLENVPVNASIGVVSQRNLYDYPFFGERFTRHITLAVPDDPASMPRIDTGPFVRDFLGVDYLLISSEENPAIVDRIIDEFDVLSNDGTIALWNRRSLRSANQCDGEKWPFTDFFYSDSGAICPQFPFLLGRTLVNGDRIAPPSDGLFFPDIGPAPKGRLRFHLLVKEGAVFEFSVEMWPQVADVQQTLNLDVSDSTGQFESSYKASFNQPQTLHFTIPLQPAAYLLEMRLAGGGLSANILKLEVTSP